MNNKFYCIDKNNKTTNFEIIHYKHEIYIYKSAAVPVGDHLKFYTCYDIYKSLIHNYGYKAIIKGWTHEQITKIFAWGVRRLHISINNAGFFAYDSIQIQLIKRGAKYDYIIQD